VLDVFMAGGKSSLLFKVSPFLSSGFITEIGWGLALVLNSKHILAMFVSVLFPGVGSATGD